MKLFVMDKPLVKLLLILVYTEQKYINMIPKSCLMNNLTKCAATEPPRHLYRVTATIIH